MTIPSTKQRVKYRPMLAKEEKVLLTIKETINQDSTTDAQALSAITQGVSQIVNNCMIDRVDLRKLASFDVEYMFVQLRIVSMGGEIEASYRSNEDNKVRKFTIDLTKVDVKFDENLQSRIKVNDDLAIELRYPSAALLTDQKFVELGEQSAERALDYVIGKCLSKVYDKENTYDADSSSPQEVEEFLDSLPQDAFVKVREFFERLPHLHYAIKYKNEAGEEREIVLSSITDFFLFS